MRATVGDEVVVERQTLGVEHRRGVIMEVITEPDGGEHFRVRWDDGRESVYVPGPDAHVLSHPAPAAAAFGAGAGGGGQARDAQPVPRPQDPVRTIMATSVEQVGTETSVHEVADALTAAEVGALMVVENGRPAGIVSERDVVHTLAEGGNGDAVWAADVMGVDTIWAQPGDSILRVGAMMREADVRHIPIQDAGELVGIVSMRDVLSVLLDALAGSE